MITLAAEHIIFENVEATGSPQNETRNGAQQLPDGFTRDPQESGKAEDTAGAISQPPPSLRRRLTFSASSVAAAGGGADEAVGSSSFRALSRSTTGTAELFGEGDDDE